MEQLKDQIHDKSRSNLLKSGDVANILGVHVEAVKTLVDMKLLPCVNISPYFEQRFREEDIRFLLLK
jgi:hypothetical protein